MKKHFFILLFLSSLISGLNAQNADSTFVQSSGIDSAKSNRFLIYPGFGVSLVRNDLSPAFYINVGLNHHDRWEVNINSASFFFFERGSDKNYKIYRNTFINAEFLLNFSVFNKKERDFNGLGVGYLIESKGYYFEESTFMVYYKRRFKAFSVMPGIVISDNFREVFPVISIRL